MKKILFLFSLFLCLHLLEAYSFDRPADSSFNCQVSVSLCRLELVDESYNHEFISKLFNYACFDYYFNDRLRGFVGLGYGKYKVIDESAWVMDAFIGEGDLEEFTLSLGVSTTFGSHRSRRLSPLLSSSVFYSRTNYTGDYHGGIGGQYFSVDRHSDKVGIGLRCGLELVVFRHFLLIPSAGVSAAMVTTRDAIDQTRESSLRPGFVPMECCLAWQF